jgi:xanthine dehydrogenase YagR molybdenum-binding subunit
MGISIVVIGATDLGTGARTAPTAVAGDASGVDPARVRLRLSGSDLGPAWGAGGSRGTTSWVCAITHVAAGLRDHSGPLPAAVTADTTRENPQSAG